MDIEKVKKVMVSIMATPASHAQHNRAWVWLYAGPADQPRGTSAVMTGVRPHQRKLGAGQVGCFAVHAALLYSPKGTTLAPLGATEPGMAPVPYYFYAKDLLSLTDEQATALFFAEDAAELAERVAAYEAAVVQ